MNQPSHKTEEIICADNALISLLSFTGKERNEETGFSYYGARYYDPEISALFLSVDPCADKYPGISPYAYCAWNSVKLVDPDGMELYIPAENSDNHEASRRDILSLLLNKKNSKYVIFDADGKVRISEEVTNGKRKMDKGLDLLCVLISSDKKFLYESSDDVSSVFRDGKSHEISDDNEKGVINASKYGKDSNGGHTHLPKEGFDGHVILAKSGVWIDGDGKSLRTSLMFHELAENYYRTHYNLDYHEAHDKARKRESVPYGNMNPGQLYKSLGVSFLYKGQKATW